MLLPAELGSMKISVISLTHMYGYLWIYKHHVSVVGKKACPRSHFLGLWVILLRMYGANSLLQNSKDLSYRTESHNVGGSLPWDSQMHLLASR